MHLAALGTISRIDLWRGNDALWQEHERVISDEGACDDPTMSSEVMSIRGDALAAAKRWCEAAKAHEHAYGALATRPAPLLAWAETSWKCDPDRKSDRTELLKALAHGLESRHFGARERASIAYLRWWLTQDPVDAQRLLHRWADVELGMPVLVEGVGSDLEPEICGGTGLSECSLLILASPKHVGDDERLRKALGLRR